NVWGKIRRSLVRAQLVGKILANTAFQKSASLYYRTFANHKERRFQRQLSRLAHLVTWQNEASVHWSTRYEKKSTK
ncbi:PIPO, partial [Achyranthes bidentata mosaic virus]